MKAWISALMIVGLQRGLIQIIGGKSFLNVYLSEKFVNFMLLQNNRKKAVRIEIRLLKRIGHIAIVYH